MNKLLELLKTMLLTINQSDDEYAIQPSKKGKGFTARHINHDLLDIDQLQSLLPTIKPGWKVTLFEASSSYDEKTGQKKTSPENLYFGPDQTSEKDDTSEVMRLFG